MGEGNQSVYFMVFKRLSFFQSNSGKGKKRLVQEEPARAGLLKTEAIDFERTVGNVEFVWGKLNHNWLPHRVAVGIENLQEHVACVLLRNFAESAHMTGEDGVACAHREFVGKDIAKNAFFYSFDEFVVQSLQIVHHSVFAGA